MTRSSSHAFLRAMRLIHLYLGVFTSPILLFFAFTGALQTFSLHETTRGSSYKPPAWAVTLGQIHKKQTPVVPVRKQPPAPLPTPAKEEAGSAQASHGHEERAGGPDAPQSPMGRIHHSLPMKIFFLISAISLFLSTLTGIYMSYKYMRNRRLITALLVLGTVIPVALVFV